MGTFVIEGGHKLSGSITPQGAKNEALQVISAVLLTSEKIIMKKVPNIVDVVKLIDLLASMGVKVEKLNEEDYSFQAEHVNVDYLISEEFKTKASGLRGSVMILGPLLARFGKAYLPQPGGDKIGRRRLDTHFIGLQKLGADFNYNPDERFYSIEGKKLQGAYMLLDEASVTGTANIIMAATLAQGETTIFNAACEPYIVQLCRMLNRMGANITGVGSNLLTIRGVKKLYGTNHKLLADMIEVGSFIGMAAMTQSEITIKDVDHSELGMIPQVFRRMGIQIENRGDDLFVPAQEEYAIETFIDGSIMTIADSPWPGFTPDLISIALVVATQAKGSVLIHQKCLSPAYFLWISLSIWVLKSSSATPTGLP
jgi:UDP-N-acetylglucosamine 1-carboxyvinyltransferase